MVEQFGSLDAVPTTRARFTLPNEQTGASSGKRGAARPDLDEDISVEGPLPADVRVKPRQSLRRWFESRKAG